MPVDDLFDLWQLHLVDKAILEVRMQAAALDPGKALMAEIKRLEAARDAANEAYKALHGEQTDIELKQKGIDEKVKKIEKDLYGGKVVNPREVENFQKEVEVLKKQRGDLDGRLLELWDLVPPAKKDLDNAEKAVQEKRAILKEHQAAVVIKQAELQHAFKAAQAKREPAAKKVDAATLARYDANRQRHEGVGMSRIEKNGSCEQCGTLLPRKTVELAKDGKMTTCEACGRILYWSAGIV